MSNDEKYIISPNINILLPCSNYRYRPTFIEIKVEIVAFTYHS